MSDDRSPTPPPSYDAVVGVNEGNRTPPPPSYNHGFEHGFQPETQSTLPTAPPTAHTAVPLAGQQPRQTAPQGSPRFAPQQHPQNFQRYGPPVQQHPGPVVQAPTIVVPIVVQQHQPSNPFTGARGHHHGLGRFDQQTQPDVIQIQTQTTLQPGLLPQSMPQPYNNQILRHSPNLSERSAGSDTSRQSALTPMYIRNVSTPHTRNIRLAVFRRSDNSCEGRVCCIGVCLITTALVGAAIVLIAIFAT